MFLKVDASAELNLISSEAQKEFEENTKISSVYYGGDGKLAESLSSENFHSTWKGTVSSNPWLFSGQVRPIWDLLVGDGARREALQWAVVTKLTRKYLADAQNSYELSSVDMSPEVKSKLAEIAQSLDSQKGDLESINREIARILEELQELIGKLWEYS